MSRGRKKWVVTALIIGAVGVVGWLLWRQLRSDRLGDGFASGNGRIEAIDIDVATKLALRVDKILVEEGDFVEPGQILARMDTQVLEAQLAQAKAQERQAENAQRAADAMVVQRESEKATAEAVVDQRKAELTAEERRFARTETLVARNAATRQELDDDRAAMLSARAALTAAKSQVASSQAAVESAKSQVIEAQSAVEAARAATKRIAVDIEDSQLKSPRLGRVQYRVARDGEVLPAGGTVLNMIDLMDVYMVFFLPTNEVGRVALGQEARLVLDAIPQYVIPAKVTFVESVAQFTPKTVETATERAKLMFRTKAHIDPKLLQKHLTQIKTGLPGVAYLRLDPRAQWPDRLQINTTP